MVVPSRERAEEVLEASSLPDGIVIHSRGVARVAAEAARLLSRAGVPVDVALVEAAALLHDIDKPGTGMAPESHGIAAASRLIQMGHEELAIPVASHPVMALGDEARYPRGWESVVVSVADRHVTQEFVTTDDRIDDLQRRYPEHRLSLELARSHALALERELAEVSGLSVEDLVERLRAAWQEGAAP